MAWSDEINSCDMPEGYPTGAKKSARPRVFCENVTFESGVSAQSSLSVQGPTELGSPLEVTGTVTCTGVVVNGETFVPTTINTDNGSFRVLAAGTPPPPSP